MIEQDTRPTETLKFQEDTFTDAFALLSQEIRKLNEQGKEVVAQKVEQDEETEKYIKKYSDAPDITPEDTAADVGFSYISF